jgi:ADP-dependent NAD(P)H-hydrate dehydratase
MSNDLPLPNIPARSLDAHKGDFGKALLMGGSRGMTGAITLSGMAALRGGAGLVKLAVAKSCWSTVAAHEPSYMTVPLSEDEAGRLSLAAQKELLELAEAATCVAIGPGLGQSRDLEQLVAVLYTQCTVPLVLDADAINALAKQPKVLRQPGGVRIITPHPGEFGRLIGAKLSETENRQRAIELAAECGIIVVLKGHHTQITGGNQTALNSTGNPGMATGGMGDVLTGLTTALICQQLTPFDAARLAVHVHGRAGDLAAAELGEVSLIASDLIRYLPAALREVSLSRD